jgi:acyl carrier protein
MKAGLGTREGVRTLIAEHLHVDAESVTDEAHFTDDLCADWLDRLELMIAIEDQLVGVEFTDDDIDQMEVVGDLIRYIESMDNGRAIRGRRGDLSLAPLWPARRR